MQENRYMSITFNLKANFRLSGAVPKECESELGALLEDANRNLLRKGAPQGQKGAEIVDWRLDEDRLYLEIHSGRYVRAHDALLRLRKPLSGTLGKKYHIGIRGIEVLDFEISSETEHELTNPRIPFVRSITYEDGTVTLDLEVDGSDLENRVPDRIMNLLEEKVEQSTYGGKGEHWELMWESPHREYRFREDPSKTLEGLGWIRRGSSRGQWIYGPEMTRVLRAFVSIVERDLLNKLGYNEMIFPKLVTWDVWKRSGHAKGVYPEIYFVCPPKTRDPDFWEEVIDHYKVTNEIPLELLKEKIDYPIGGMCYAQCPPFWVFVQGETIADDCMPVKVFDRSGTSHRYESGGLHGMERVDEFHRIEVLWMGTPEQMVEHSKELQECYKHIFNDVLELEWRQAWVTPWFMAQEGMTGLDERKTVGTIDYEALLPYNESWLEFQNLSVNGDKYPRGFNVKLQSGEDLWSGCSGIGLERWASAFFAQHGPNPDDWPNGVLELVGELPRDVFKFL